MSETAVVKAGFIPEGQKTLTTAEASIYLGVSRTRVFRLLKTDRLQAHFDTSVKPHGLWRYSRQSVEQYKAERDAFPQTGIGVYVRGALAHEGVIAAAAFELFDQKKSIAEVVKALRVKPDRVRRLWQEYKTPLGQRVITPEAEHELWERERQLKELQIAEDKARAMLLRATKPNMHTNGKAKP